MDALMGALPSFREALLMWSMAVSMLIPFTHFFDIELKIYSFFFAVE